MQHKKLKNGKIDCLLLGVVEAARSSRAAPTSILKSFGIRPEALFSFRHVH